MLQSIIKAPVILERLGIGEVQSDAVLGREVRSSEGLLEGALLVRRKPVDLEIGQAPPRLAEGGLRANCSGVVGYGLIDETKTPARMAHRQVVGSGMRSARHQ